MLQLVYDTSRLVAGQPPFITIEGLSKQRTNASADNNGNPQHRDSVLDKNNITTSSLINSIVTQRARHEFAHILLAHGAGAPMDSPFMEDLSQRLIAHGITVSRFEFSYMAQRRVGGTRRPPPRMPILEDEYANAVENALKPSVITGRRIPFFIGGKSMGGRVASLIANDLFLQGIITGLVCIGYPFHPAKKPEKLRTEHLKKFTCPTLIVQGDRDALGSYNEVQRYKLRPSISLAWMEDGDHDLAPRKKSGLTHSHNMAAACLAIKIFAKAHANENPYKT